MKKKLLIVILCTVLLLSGSSIGYAASVFKDEPYPSAEPSATPLLTPEPTAKPSLIPEPSAEPSLSPEPTAEPSLTPEPTAQPSVTPEPTAQPSSSPGPSATAKPSSAPTQSPKPSATTEPTPEPSALSLSAQFAQSTDIALPFSVTRTLDIAGQFCAYNDFNFTLSENAWLFVEQTNSASEYYILNLLDSSGKVIGVAPPKSNMCDMSFERIISTYVPAGSYTLRVLRDETRGFAAGEYTLSIATEALDLYDLSEYNLAMQANSPDQYWHFDNDSRGLDRTAGNIYKTLAVWSRAKGPVNETDDPYMLYYYDHEDFEDVNLLDGSLLTYRDIAPSYTLSQAVMLPARRSFNDNSHYKSAIQNYGALYAGIIETNEFFTNGDKYFYCPLQNSTGTGHAITLIGWDDTIAKENFTVSYEGSTYTPPIDGAFIAKNSYSPQSGDNGYFYISYGSYCFSNNAATALILDDMASPSGINTLYYNDPLGMTNNSYTPQLFIGSEAYTKDIFTASGDQTVREIGIYLTSPDECYEIFLTKNGVKTAVAAGQKQYAGYYRIKLDASFLIKSGEQFIVETHLFNKSGEQFASAVEMPITPYYSRASAQAGTSFFSKNGADYTDISDAYDANNCVKVYASDPSKAEGTLVYGNTPIEEEPQRVFSSDELTDITQQSPSFEAESSITAQAASASSLTAVFDLRNISAVTKVKNQSLMPNCWAFASCASAESILLRKSLGLSSDVSLSLDKTSETITLCGNTWNFELSAFVSPSTADNAGVYYNFYGDLGSIDILNYKAASGAKTALFAAKDAGTIIIEAVCAADGTKTAKATVEITNDASVPEASAASAKSPKTGDAANPAALITVLAASLVVLFMLLFCHKRAAKKMR